MHEILKQILKTIINRKQYKDKYVFDFIWMLAVG